MSADELRLDLEELRRLEGLATRPRVLSLLANEIRSVDAKLAPRTAPVPAPKAVAAAAPSGVSYVTLGSFSWDQDNEKIRVYVFLENVDQEKVETTFKPMSVDIKFHDVKGKNYRCAIPKLNKEIVPEKCKVVVKPTKIVITLWKASTGSWLDLHYKEDKVMNYYKFCAVPPHFGSWELEPRDAKTLHEENQSPDELIASR